MQTSGPILPEKEQSTRSNRPPERPRRDPEAAGNANAPQTATAPPAALSAGTASDQAIEGQALAVLIGAASRAIAAAPPPNGTRADGSVSIALREPLGLSLAAMTAETLLNAGVEPRHPVIKGAVDRIVARFPAKDGTLRRTATNFADVACDGRALAHAMRLFVRLGRRDLIAAHCEPPLAVLLAYAEADGVIPAWSLPDDSSSEAVETIAGLVHALAVWDARRFLGMIVAGARWVAERQQPDGSWRSADDGYYGSWQALRLLGAAMPNHPAVARAAQHLHDRRQPGAGWGTNGSDLRSTALALLALRATRADLPEDLLTSARAVLAAGMRAWLAPAPLSLAPSLSGGRTAPEIDGSVVTALWVLKACQALQPAHPPR